jgi:AcrR family transcriptional regulator
LARELEVGVMALYGYVRTKDELFDGVTDAIIRQLDLTADPASPRDEQLATIFTKLPESLDRQPGARELLLLRSAEGPAINRVRETGTGILRSAGYRPARSLHAPGPVLLHTRLCRNHESAEVNVRTFPDFAQALLAYPERTAGDAYTAGLRFLIDGIAPNVNRNEWRSGSPSRRFKPDHRRRRP